MLFLCVHTKDRSLLIRLANRKDNVKNYWPFPRLKSIYKENERKKKKDIHSYIIAKKYTFPPFILNTTCGSDTSSQRI